jgi:hypothetical protein
MMAGKQGTKRAAAGSSATKRSKTARKPRSRKAPAPKTLGQALARITQLETAQAEIAERLGKAIEAIRKLLEA